MAKRKHGGNDKEKDDQPMQKKVTNDTEAIEDDEDDPIDVQSYFVQDCEEASKELLKHARIRRDELRKEFALAKQAILDGIIAEKENLGRKEASANAAPTAYDITIKCIAGPYKGHSYALVIDIKSQPTCMIGRSTGRKFKVPRGLSLPKDSELSTTHAELRLKPDGQVFYVDLDSTNGSYINDEGIEPHELCPISTSEPTKLSVGGSELLLTLAKRS